jgi:hypothetical protein
MLTHTLRPHSPRFSLRGAKDGARNRSTDLKRREGAVRPQGDAARAAVLPPIRAAGVPAGASLSLIFRNHRAAMAVGCGDKTRSDVVAEKRNFRDVGSLLDLDKMPPVSLLFSEYPSAIWAPKADARQADALLHAEVRHLAGEGRGPFEPQRAGWTREG